MGNISKTISYFKRNGIKTTISAVVERIDQKHFEQTQKWVQNYEGCRNWSSGLEKDEMKIKYKEQSAHVFDKEYSFSVIVPAYETNQDYMKAMIKSVVRQSYKRVELIIADASKSNKVLEIVEAFKKEHPQFQIKYIRLKENLGISENTMEALKEAEGDYIGLLDHDDTLTLDALYEVNCALQDKEYSIVYTDEDKTDSDMRSFYEPNFKPEFNLDYLLSNNYVCHFLVMKADLMKKLGFRKEYDGAQDYDLILRGVGELLHGDEGLAGDLKQKICHIPKVLYHWRCHEASTASNTESKRYAYDNGKSAIEDFLKRRNISDVSVSHTSHLGFYKVNYGESDNIQKLFEKRPEVAAVCTRLYKGNLVVKGPRLKIRGENVMLFQGLLKFYGGYMHRARMILEVDSVPEETVIWNEYYRQLFLETKNMQKEISHSEKMEIANRNGHIFLYIPNTD